MKKIVVVLMAVVLLLGLCACGKEEPAPTEPVLHVQPKEEAAPAVPEVVETQAATEAAPEKADPAASKKVLAESCIDKDISELYALIGEPASSDYAPSCLEEGGEDGSLYYDGFVVYTIRVGDVETVYYVE